MLSPRVLTVKSLSGQGPLRFSSSPTFDLRVALTSTLAPEFTPPCPVFLLLQVFDDFIFIFFAMEMVLKMVALGIFGKKCYLGDTWNRLDFFIVMAG